MSQSILLFYSNRCGHSRQFLQELQPLGVASSVHKICIDTTPRERIPSSVRSVPTLILAGQMTPLVGDQAFGWLNEQKQRQQAQAQQRMQQQSSQSGAAVGGEPNAPSAWQSTEMGATFSDSYSFLDNSFTEMGVGSPQAAPKGSGGGSTIPKAFAYISAPSIDVKNPQYAQPSPGGRPGGPGGPGGPAPRAAMPSGYGSLPPNATMAPPTQNYSDGSNKHSDELTERMEALRMARDQDAPMGMGRVG